MRPEKVIIIDCNAVCYSAYFTFASLSFDDQGTGVIYGFFSQIQTVCKTLGTAHLAFCWDSRQSRRKLLFPEYKSNRKKDDPNLVLALAQFARLRKEILPRLGFGNVFHHTGFEADDLIASLCLNDEPKDDQKYFIVSGDQDLYQLLTPDVSMFKTGRHGGLYTLDQFHNDYGIEPVFWPEVKAIAGCSSDALPGIAGVGEKTAIQFIKNCCAPKRHAKIESRDGLEIRRRNRPLVRLPLSGTPVLRFDWESLPSFAEWVLVCEELGFDSFLTHMSDWEAIFARMAPASILRNKVRFGRRGRDHGSLGFDVR